MAIADRLEAVRSVLLSNGYTQSTEPDAFDTTASTRLHRQFYFEGPRIAEPATTVALYADVRWELTVWFAAVPRRGADDPDHGRFEVAALIDELIELWASDDDITCDEFHFVTGDPQWDDDNDFWAVRMDIQLLQRRTFAA